jgi:cytoskeleton protein RodZ
MESLGQKLSEARERHNVSLEQVARDTHISKQYLEALEEESFGIIPGETYIVGFLRNYAEYLGLNPEELVSLYKNLKIQEQPLPMTELLDRGQPKVPRRLIALIVVLLVVLGGAAYLIYRLALVGRESAPAAEVAPASAAATAEEEYEFREEAITRWFDQSDVIVVPLDGSSYRVGLAEVGDKLSVRVPGGTVELNIGEERQLDLNTDGRNDVRLRLNDLDATQLARRANISLYKITKESLPQLPRGAQESAASAESPLARTAEAPGSTGAGSESQGGMGGTEEPVGPPIATAAGGGTVTVLTAAEASPFRIGISFRGYCLLRYRVDDDVRDERFFHKGETFALDVRNQAMLWISNAGALRMVVGGREVELGRPGAVTAKLVGWNRDEDSGQYVLQVLDRE